MKKVQYVIIILLSRVICCIIYSYWINFNLLKTASFGWETDFWMLSMEQYIFLTFVSSLRTELPAKAHNKMSIQFCQLCSNNSIRVDNPIRHHSAHPRTNPETTPTKSQSTPPEMNRNRGAVAFRSSLSCERESSPNMLVCVWFFGDELHTHAQVNTHTHIWIKQKSSTSTRSS